jgi:hypothetical protein
VTDQTPATPLPRTIQITWIATLVAAAFSVLGPAAYFTARDWIEQQQRHSISDRKITTSYTAADQAKDLANVAGNVNRALPIQLVFGAIGAALLVFIALKIRDGRYWSRWALVGVWVLITLTGYSPVGLGGLLVLGSSAPALVKATSFLGAASFLVALIAVNLRPSVTYLNASRPPSTGGGGGLGGLFRPRPASPPPAPPRAQTPRPAAPRTTPPAPPVQRTKAKARPASTDSTGQAPPATPSSSPKGSGAGRSRGKSRGR